MTMQMEHKDDGAPSLLDRDWTLSIEQYPAPLDGVSLETHGAKNSALPIMMYCFLMDGSRPIVIDNIPNIADVHDVLNAFAAMGGVATYSPEIQRLDVFSGITSGHIPPGFIEKTRISVLLMSILLARFGEVRFPKSVGGCKLGDRKYDYHLNAFVEMGCSVKENEDFYLIEWSNRGVMGANVTFPQATTTGTENALFLASYSKEDVRIQNAHLRPEVIELIHFMNKMGANIQFDDNSILVHPLLPSWDQTGPICVIDDLEEAISKLALASIIGGSCEVKYGNLYPYQEIDFVTRFSSGEIHRSNGSIIHESRPGRVMYPHVTLKTAPYPGIGSDSQPILAGYLLGRTAALTIEETRFTSRFAFAKYLESFGVQIGINGNKLDVSAIPKPSDSEDDGRVRLVSYDLRSAMNAVLTSTFFRRRVDIEQAGLLQRGYADILATLDTFGYNYSIQ